MNEKLYRILHKPHTESGREKIESLTSYSRINRSETLSINDTLRSLRAIAPSP